MKIAFLSALLFCTSLTAAPVPVSISPQGVLQREGKDYFIRGVGGETRLDEAARRGANCARTWSTNGLEATLDTAQKLGLTVCAGMWIEPECSWFSYGNPEHCARQEKRILEEVRKFRDHPALLAWGIGNEAEGDGKNEAFWKQLNRLALAVKKEDPHHPTFTAVAGLSPDKAAGLAAHAPALDFVGINTYGALFGLRKHLAALKWTRPWAVTEFGPQGFWESPRSEWNAPLEQTSTQKAQMLRKAWAAAMSPDGGCLGGHVFLWGQKQEATATWFSLFTADGHTVASVDVMQELWTGKPPANRAPDIQPLDRAAIKKPLAPGAKVTLQTTATDPDGDPITWHWHVAPESGPRDKEGRELPLKPVDCVITGAGTNRVEVTLPAKPGTWRIFAEARDGKGHAATANVPVKTE